MCVSVFYMNLYLLKDFKTYVQKYKLCKKYLYKKLYKCYSVYTIYSVLASLIDFGCVLY